MKSDGLDNLQKDVRGCHDGHRGRLREKFLKNGADSLETHELLELLLFYCIPRRNTNEIAHEMLERFGSLDALLSADKEALTQVDYVSDSGAVLIKLVGELNRRRMIEKSDDVYRYDSIEKVGDFLVRLFYGVTEERLYLLSFDGAMRMLDCTCIGEGNISTVNMCARKIIESTLYSKAENIILAHNHPNGIAVPSKNDLSLTHQLESVMSFLDTKLLCHVIVAGDKYAPVSRSYSGGFDLTI